MYVFFIGKVKFPKNACIFGYTLSNHAAVVKIISPGMLEVVLKFYVQPTADVIRRRNLGAFLMNIFFAFKGSKL